MRITSALKQAGSSILRVVTSDGGSGDAGDGAGDDGDTDGDANADQLSQPQQLSNALGHGIQQIGSQVGRRVRSGDRTSGPRTLPDAALQKMTLSI